MEAFVEAFVRACVEVTSVETFKLSISSLGAFVEAFVVASMQVVSEKASKPSAKACINSIKASMEAFGVGTAMEAFVEAFVDA